jgi:hypothetical protein
MTVVANQTCESPFLMRLDTELLLCCSCLFAIHELSFTVFDPVISQQPLAVGLIVPMRPCVVVATVSLAANT